MNLAPDDDLRLIAETARRFGEDVLIPRMRSAEADRAVDSETQRAFAEIGLAGLELPEELDGAGLGCVARVLVNEELAASDAGAALALDRLGPAFYPILEMGGDVSELAGGKGRILLVTDLDGDFEINGDRISGTAAWVPAAEAEALVVLVKDQAALVREGWTIEPVRGAGLRAAGAGVLRLIDAPVGALLSNPTGASRALARARLYVASLLLGVLRAACDFSRDYAKERQAFGKPIAHHQALAFLITDMQMALDGARLLVHEAAWRLDAGLPSESAAASALAECIDASRLIGPSGVQILGGHGFMADYPVEKHMREARALGLLFGGFDAAVEESGRRLCETDAPLAIGVGEAL
jgi:alkylation response protein AidB-like acyl-CoA dehydrogenase